MRADILPRPFVGERPTHGSGEWAYLKHGPVCKLLKCFDCIKTPRLWSEISNTELDNLNIDIPAHLEGLGLLPLTDKSPYDAKIFKARLRQESLIAKANGRLGVSQTTHKKPSLLPD